MSFDTALSIADRSGARGRWLATQEDGGHTSLHDDATAAQLAAGPIEGPMHLSQFVRSWRTSGVAWPRKARNRRS